MYANNNIRMLWIYTYVLNVKYYVYFSMLFTCFLKMLEINERYESGMPVIIEGETGVGKTFLIEMLASLWNQSLIDRLIRMRLKLWLLMKKIIS